MAPSQTDYLVIGAGATGLAFADTLLQESDARITLVDEHAQPGGHWNDAYPFVTLHQPSAFYGVNSLPLGTGRKDTAGPNAGLYELASGAEVTSYFHKVVHERLLPSGRVHYLPMHRFAGMDGGVARVRSLLSGAEARIAVRRKRVDATFFSPRLPATSRPQYGVGDGVRLVTPTQLTQLWQAGAQPPARFCIVGAGKTAMDACVWLRTGGVPQEAIHWVVPRDSWVVNRLTTQPGEEFFAHSIGGQVRQMQAIAEATGIDDLFERLEAAGQMLRVDRGRMPRMFHYATLAEGEIDVLRTLRNVIRLGRVRAIEPDGLVLEHGRHALPADTLYVDCSASAVHFRTAGPVFAGDTVTPQLVRAPLVSFSAALCAWVEVHHADDAAKNRLCTPVPFPRNLAGYVVATMANLENQMRWGQDKALRAWMRDSRLDGFGRMVAGIAPDDREKAGLLAAMRQQAMAAAANAPRLLAASPAA